MNVRPGPRTMRILAVLAANPDGLPTAEIARLCDDGTAKARNRCGVTLHEQALRGRVRRAGQLPGTGRAILWQIAPEAAQEPPRQDERPRDEGTRHAGSEAREQLATRIRLESRRLALMQRKAAALAQMEEGIEELEQADREIEALEGGRGLEDG